MITEYKLKIRQRIAIVKSCHMYGSSSQRLRRILFSTYVVPLFTWLFGIFPLLTSCQQNDLNHFYMSCLKRTLGVWYWNDYMFSALYEERSLDNLCSKYWKKYKKALMNTVDGTLLFEQLALNAFRSQWLDKASVVTHIYRSKRIVPHVSTIEKSLKWLEDSEENSTPCLDESDINVLGEFPISFL